MNLFQDDDRQRLVTRIESLGADSIRRWGTMTLPQALAHMAKQLQLALGELEVASIRNPASWPGVKHLVIHFMPMPKGFRTAPALLATDATEIDLERRRLITCIDRVAELGRDHRWAPHPLFGGLSGRDWGVLMARHLDHHLRQFSA